MAKQPIDLGTIDNDGTGDSLRVGGGKVNDNFDELYDGGDIDTRQYTTGLANPSHSEGLVFYDDTKKALSYYNDQPNTVVSIGQELIIKVFNDNGAIVTNGTVVNLSTPVGGLPTVVRAQADTVNNARVAGVATHDIPVSGTGYITLVGNIGGLDTSSFSAGDDLFVSATVAGELTNIQQPILSAVGRVMIVDASVGEILVAPRGILNITAIGQTRGQDQVQAITTTPTKCYCFDLNETEINVTIDQTQNPVGGEDGYDAVMSPTSIGASGFYRFYFNISIDATGNVKHIFELYINGSPTGIVSAVDLSNNQITAGGGSLTGITESILTDSDTIEIFVYTDSGTSTVTYESALSGIERIGNA